MFQSQKNIAKVRLVPICTLLIICSCNIGRHLFPTEYIYNKSPIILKINDHPPKTSKIEDKNCENTLEDLGRRKITIDIPDGSPRMDFNFNGVSGFGLKNKYHAGVYHSAHIVTKNFNCNKLMSYGYYKCESSTKEIRHEGELVNICKKSPYSDESIENIALSITAAIIKTSRFYESISELDWDKDIKIILQPFYEDIIEAKDKKVRSFQVNNARWTNLKTHSSNFSIEFLPHSNNFHENSTQKKHFYLQLAVASHELGHHFFYSRAEKMAVEDFELFTKLGQDAKSAKVYQSYNNNIDNKRKVNLGLVINAFNEGFADLIAFYTFSAGDNEYGKLEIGVKLKARNLAIGISDDNKTKALSRKVLNFFYADKKTRAKRLSPDYQDIHTVGAFLAYSADQLFKEKVKATSITPRAKERGKLALKWLDQVVESFEEKTEFYQRNYRDLLKEISWIAVKISSMNKLRGSKIRLSRKQCKIVRENFPVYVKDWEGKYSCT